MSSLAQRHGETDGGSGRNARKAIRHGTPVHGDFRGVADDAERHLGAWDERRHDGAIDDLVVEDNEVRIGIRQEHEAEREIANLLLPDEAARCLLGVLGHDAEADARPTLQRIHAKRNVNGCGDGRHEELLRH